MRGDSIYTKALFTANPFSWLDFYGQFLYSQPETNVNYNQLDTGSLVLLSSLLFYTGEQELGFAAGEAAAHHRQLGLRVAPVEARARARILDDRPHAHCRRRPGHRYDSAARVRRPDHSVAAGQPAR